MAVGVLALVLCGGLAGCSHRQRAEVFLSGEEQESTPVPEDAEEDPQEQLEEGESDGDQQEMSGEISQESQEEIFVDVCGAVAAPGVYRLPPGSRVYQAVELAGGFLPEAAGTCINQAEPLNDGEQVYVPTKEEAEERHLSVPGNEDGMTSEIAGGSESAEQKKVNLNTADSSELQTLSGIGEAKAEAILAYREEHGGFSSIEEIMNVPGIKESTFFGIKDKIAVE